MGVEAIQLSFVEKNPSEKTDFSHPLDECIGCGSCANNCPTGAISKEIRNGSMVLRMCGGEMSRHKMLQCPDCGEYYIAEKHFEYLQERFLENPRLKYVRKLCPACSRKAYPGRYLGEIPA
jgi:ferredoxin